MKKELTTDTKLDLIASWLVGVAAQCWEQCGTSYASDMQKEFIEAGLFKPKAKKAAFKEAEEKP